MQTPTDLAGRDRREVHNASVDEQVAEAGACGQVHLQTGRTCLLSHRHPGSCDFVPRDEVERALRHL